MIIFGDSISGNCLKVKWVADYLRIDYSWREIDILKGQSRTPEYLALNPAGQVPTVVLDDGWPLAQSNAIMLHLAEGSDLIPVDRCARARMFEWLFWEQYSHEPYVAVARFQVRYQGKAPEALEPRLVERAHAALARLQAGTGEGGFLVAERLSLADVALVAYTRMAGEGGLDLDGYPKLQAWIARVEGVLGLEPYVAGA